MTIIAPPPEGVSTTTRIHGPSTIGPILPPFARPDYNFASPHEVAKLAVRYRKTSGGNTYRTWRPSKERAAAVRAIVFERDDHTCQACGFQGEPDAYGLVLDHVIPYRDGGLFYPGNLQTLCHPCNSRKGASA